MPFPAAALHLAGFMLAHAFWSVSDLPAGADYVPQVICESSGGDRQLTTFDGATLEESYARLREFASAETGRYADCAFARTAMIAAGERKVPSLVIDLFDGAEPVLTVIQPYRPASEGGFRLLGMELVLDNARLLPRHVAEDAIDALREGAGDHPGMQERWAEWNAAREAQSPLAEGQQ